MKIVSIFAGHDASLTFYDSDKSKYHIIELERLVKKRYFRLHVDNSREEIRKILIECKNIARDFWGFDKYDAVIVTADGGLNPENVLLEVFETNNILWAKNHHECHAYCAFYLSPFEESLIISFDGGGNDGFFNIYLGNSNGINQIESIKSDFGGGYLLGASILKEISEKSCHQLSLAGKMMGLCAYGKPRKELVDSFKKFFFDKDYKKLSSETGLDLLNLDNPWSNPMRNAKFQEQDAYDLAATIQLAFEEAFLDIFNILVKKFPSLPVCISGGGGLNVLLNERIRNEYNVELFIPPNPNDCGLSLGAIFMAEKPKVRPSVAYSGIPLLDKENLSYHVEHRGARLTNCEEMAQLLKQGKILGIVYGDSEVGPRALGNRSIVCDPAFEKMKDILNSKVKFREWFRPFAPFCKKENASTYFDSQSFDNLEFMSFAPAVKNEFKQKLPAITHIDGSSRLQTVTENSHKLFYNLLTEFEKISETAVLLNTSFNIRGLPILTTIEDALYVLDNTQLDYAVIENYIFAKK